MPQEDERRPEYWDWLETLDEKYCASHKLMIKLYRLIDPEGSIRKPNLEVIDVYEAPITQAYIIKNFGGGHYRLITTVNGQIKYDELLRVAGKSKEIDGKERPQVGAVGTGGAPQSDIARALENQTQLLREILLRNDNRPAIDDAYRGGLQLQADALRTGVDAVRSMVTAPAAAAPNPMDDLMRQLMTAVIAKMMNPADPIEQFGKMATAMAAINPGGGGGSTSWGVEAVRAIGQALPSIAQAISAYSAAAMRAPVAMPPGGRTIDVTQPAPMRANADDRRFDPQGGAQQQPTALPEPTPITAAAKPQAAAPPPQGGEVQSPNFEWLETRIVAIANNLQLSPQDAASETLVFLQSAAPNILPQLCADASLRWLFANRTILQQIPDNPRRERFIQHFLAFAAGTPLPPDEPEAPAPSVTGDGLLFKPEPPAENPPPAS